MPLVQWLKIDRSRGVDAASSPAQVLASGGVIVAPTETVYGVLCRADRPDALARLRHLRGGQHRALTMHVANPEQAEPFIDPPGPYARRIMRSLWPGPVSIIVHASSSVTDACHKRGIDPADLYERGMITLRCPSHPLTRRILEACPHPVVGAAAPLSPTRPEDLSDAVRGGGDVDLVVDDGPTALSKPSTVISLHNDRFEIVRPGVYDRRIIEKMLQTTVLFVCSGNTCRSPMAEAIARKVIADSLKLPEDELSKAGYTIVSAGASAMPGSPATPNAVVAVRELGGDLARHRSRPLTRQLVEQATVIFAMGRSHLAAIRMIDPAAESKTTLLDPDGDVDDPIGGDLGLYKSLAQRIKSLVERRLADKTLLRREKSV